MSTLTEYAEQGDLAGIERLLDPGANIDQRDDLGRTAVMAATYAQQSEAVALLFSRGANPDLRDNMLNNPFLYAGAEGLLEILKLAHEAGANPAIPNRYGGVAIIPAAEHGHLAVIEFLLDQTTINVNHINNLGWTALLEAIILSDGGPTHQQVVRVLLAGGADPNLADAQGVTPLAHARQRGFAEIERILLDAGAHE
jgi:ankyrin repeat protein